MLVDAEILTGDASQQAVSCGPTPGWEVPTRHCATPRIPPVVPANAPFVPGLSPAGSGMRVSVDEHEDLEVALAAVLVVVLFGAVVVAGDA